MFCLNYDLCQELFYDFSKKSLNNKDSVFGVLTYALSIYLKAAPVYL